MTPAPPPRPRAVLAALAVFAVCALVLNASALAQAADRQPDGWRRTAAVAVTDAASAVADRAGLGAVRGHLEETGARLYPPAVPSRVGASLDGSPVRVLLVGDSMAENTAAAFAGELAACCHAELYVLAERGMSLGMPELFDWPAAMAAAVERHQPDHVLVLLGPPAGTDDDGPEGWETWYADLVGEAVAALANHDTQVWWLGGPYTNIAEVETARPRHHAAVRAALAGTPNATFVPTHDAVTDGTGFTRHLDDRDRRRQVRDDDGVHFTAYGAQLYARWVVERTVDTSPRT